MEKNREIVGVRHAPTHKENPFLRGSVVQIKGRKKQYTVSSAKDNALVNQAGQIVGTVQHSITRIVDDTKFVKVFADGIASIYDLKTAGSKVFRFLFEEVQKNPGQDRLYLYFMDAVEDPWRIPKTTFFKGLAELLERGFVAKSSNPNIYFLNPAMLWNGDRFRFIQEYQRASVARPVESGQLMLENIDQETGEIPLAADLVGEIK
jgi:hypothetical protein